MKKYIFILGASLFTTAAVTATVLAEKTPDVKKSVECTQKMEKSKCTKAMKKSCTRMQRTDCFERVL